MCDNFVVLPNFTNSGRMLFAKNSDRPAYESQPLAYHSRQAYESGSRLKLAYTEISQVKETYLTIGSSPFWCWGYEQGINEHGVVIGNEAIFTKDLKGNESDFAKEKGIIGMELVRLGLERAKTAQEALTVITFLIEEYGQWGIAVVGEENFYNNAILIADANEAWVLETADKQWIAKKVEDKFHSISNEMSIRREWDAMSDQFINQAVESGWIDSGKDFDAAYAYTDFTKSLQVSHIRVQRTKQLLGERLAAGQPIDVNWMKRILRDHYEDTFLEGPSFNAALPDFQTICMHSSPANFTWGITASSTIFELPKEEGYFPIIWWSPATPCTGVYLPIFMCNQTLPDIITNAGTVKEKTFDPTKSAHDQSAEDSYWWVFRDLLEELKGDKHGTIFTKNREYVREIFNEIEAKWLQKTREVETFAAELNLAGEREEAAEHVANFTRTCFQEALEAIKLIKANISVKA